jgi:hypothetical protein
MEYLTRTYVIKVKVTEDDWMEFDEIDDILGDVDVELLEVYEEKTEI